MRGVRNQCVGRGVVARSSSTVAYTVPADHTFILKSVLLTNLDSIDSNNIGIITSVDHSATLFLYSQPIKAGGGLYAWGGWTVLNAGDFVQLNGGAGAVQYWVAGAVLPDASL